MLATLCQIVFRWLPDTLTNEKSILVQVKAWCHQATSHYLSECWPRSPSPYGIARPQWIHGIDYIYEDRFQLPMLSQFSEIIKKVCLYLCFLKIDSEWPGLVPRQLHLQYALQFTGEGQISQIIVCVWERKNSKTASPYWLDHESKAVVSVWDIMWHITSEAEELIS